MTRMKRKAQTWHLKGTLGVLMLFAAGLFAAGAFGGVSPLGDTSSGATDTGTSAVSSDATDTTTASQSPSTVPYIVTFASDTSADQQTSEIAAAGATDTGAIAPLSMHTIDVPSDSEQAVVAALQSDADVADVERDHSREAGAAPSDPGYADQWNLPMIGWDQIYGSLNPMGSSTIAVLDTGVSSSTSDLNLGSGWSAFGSDPGSDSNGHGTAVASIAAATANNGIGIAGVDFGNVTILPVQVLDSNGLGQDSDIIQGVVWAADHGANVILMSFSNPGFSQALQDAVNYAWGNGAVVVAATGNDGSASPTYPAGDADVMGVAGTDRSDQPWASSNTGADTFLAAPATNVPADATDGSETAITGTSASAAMVAGAAALLLANDPLATNAIIDGRLARNAAPVGTADQTGNGRLDLARAVTDTSTDQVTPLGAPGGGGPVVGPYKAASNSTFTGTVRDSSTNTPIAGATVTVSCPGCNGGGGSVSYTGGGSSTNSTGQYSVTLQYAGQGPVTATPTASATGYTSNSGATTTCSQNGGGACTPDPDNISLTPNTPVADLAVTKTDGVTSVNAGGTTTYTIRVTNNGPSAVTGATLTDAAATGLSKGTIACSATPGQCTAGTTPTQAQLEAGFALPALANGQFYEITAQASVTATSGSVSNTATIAAPSGTTDPTTTNNSATDTDTVNPVADLVVTKTDGVTSVNAGGSTTYTIRVTNNGPSTVTGATLTDAAATGLSKGTIACSSATGNQCSSAPSKAQLETGFALPALASGQFYEITVQASVTATSGSVSNTATIAAPSGTSDPTASNNSATDTDTITQTADLSVTKTDSKGGSSITSTTGSVVAGTQLTYTVKVSNAGPSTATGASVTDSFPVDFSGATWTAAQTGGATGFTASGSGNINDTVTMPSGSTITYTVTGTVKSSATGTLSNTANANVAAGTSDPTAANNSATDQDTITKTADLSVTKTDNKGGSSITSTTGSVTAGTSMQYTVKVSNAGPSDAVGASVTDNFTSDFTGATWTASGTTGTSFTATGTGNISDTVTIPSGGSITYTVSGTVKSSATGTLSNTASAADPVGTTDPATGNNSATDTDTITQSADLSVTKTDNKGGSSIAPTTGSVVAGTQLTYTVTASNSGASDAVGATVTDTFPSDFTGATWTATQSGGATGFTATGSGNINDTVTMPAGSSITYTVTGTVKSSATGTLNNTATVSAPNGTTDPTAGNNSATDSDTITRSADLSVTKTDNKGGSSITSTTGSVVAGTSLQYTVKVSNSGPSDAVGATVQDTFPSDFTGATWTATQSGGATGFTATGSGNINDTVNMLAGSSITYTVSGTVKSSAAGTLSNTASATVGAGTTDPTPGNNSATDTDTITRSADLSVTKTDNKGGSSITPTTGSVVAGTQLTYTVTASNSGPSDAVGATVQDTFPSDFTGATWTATQSGGATGFTASGSGNINDTVNMPSGSTITYTVTGTVKSSATGVLNNTATVSAPNGTTDPTPANNSATDSDTITKTADLSVVKSDDHGGNSATSTAGTVIPGTGLTYTITVSNSGPSDSVGATVTDTFPSDFTGATWTANGTGGASGFAASGTGNIDGTVNIPSGGTVTYTVSGTVKSSATGTLSNTASAADASGTTDSDGTNNSATDTDNLTPQADLGLTKDDGTDTVVAGTSSTYTVTLTNHGFSDAPAGQVVTDPAPAGTTISSSDSRCSISSNVATCTTSAALPAGQSTTFALTLAVAPNYVTAQGTSLTNTASITSTSGLNQQTNPSNDTASDTDTVVANADLGLTKDDGTDTVVAGTSSTYTVTLTNHGHSDAPAGQVVTDPAPAGTTISSSDSRCSTSSNIATCTTSAALPAGQSTTFALTLAVDPNYVTAQGTSLTNTASITATSGLNQQTNPSNDTASDTDTVVANADLGLTKDDGTDTVVAGTSSTYTVTLTNHGHSDAPAGQVVTDPAPAGTTISSSDSRCSISSNVATCTTSAALPAGQSTTFALTLAVDPNYVTAQGTSLTNTASITSTSGLNQQTNPSNDTANDTDTVVARADLSVTKSGPSSAIAGSTYSYTLTVKNNGPSNNVGGLTVSDTLASELSFMTAGSSSSCSASGQVVTCADSTGLTAGATESFTIVVKVDPATTPGTVVANHATVGSDGTTDANDTNDQSSPDTLTTITSDVELSVTKTFSPSTVTAGDGSHSFTVAVTNTGTFSTAHAVHVTDSVPGAIAVDAVHDDQGDTNCTASAGQSIDCTFALLPAGQTATVTVTYHVDPATPAQSVDNTGSASSPDNNSSDSDQATLSIVSDVALALTKTFTPSTVIAGSGDHTFTLAVKNTGSFSTAHSVEVTDSVDSKLVVTDVSQDQGAGGTCAPASQSIDCTFALLPAGQIATVTVTYHVEATTQAQSVDNSALAASPDNSAFTSDAKTLTIASDASLSLTKTFEPSTVTAGDGPHTFTLAVTNTGNFSTAHNVSVTDAVDPNLVVTAVHDDQGDTNCAASSGQSIDCTFALLPHGQTATVTVSYHVDPATTAQSVDNTGTASSPDNNSSDSDQATLTIVSDVALSLTKTFTPDTVIAGDGPHTFTLAVKNTGAFSTAHAVHLTDTVDPNLVVTAVHDDQGDTNCSASSGQSIDCTFGALPAGDTATVTVTYHVDPATQAQSVDNTGTASTPDNNSSDSDQATLTITSDVALSVAKSFSPSTVTAGDGPHTFTLAVTNTGSLSTAHAVHLTDTVDPQLVVTAVHDDQGDTNCAASSSQSIDCTFALLPAGQTATVTVTYHVDPATQAQSVDNTGSASSPDNNSSDSDQATLTIVSDVELALTKTFTPDTVIAGDGPHTFSLSVTNTGTFSTAHSVEVTDSVDPSLVVTGVSQDQGAGGTCSPASQSIDCTFALLPHGQTATVTVTYHVDPATPAGPVTNTANASSPDNNSSDSSTKTLTITSDVALSVAKSFSPSTVTAGDGTHAFTLAVTNTGTFSTAHAVHLTDTVDPQLVVTAVHDDQGDTNCAASSGQSIDCTFALLPHGQTATMTVTYHVDPATQAQSIDNTGTATSPDNNSSDSDQATLTIVSDVALTLAKTFTPSSVIAGSGDHTFTLSVTNTGSFSTAHSVEVTDSVDSKLVVTDVSQDQGAGGTCSPASQSIDCTIALLPHGQTATVTVTYHVDPATQAQQVDNTALAASPDNSAFTSDNATLTITSDASLSLTKAFDPSTVTAGDGPHTFTLAVKNTGSFSTAHSVEVIDPVDSKLIVIGVSQDQGSNGDCTASFGQMVDCTFALLPAGDTATVTVTYEVAATTQAQPVDNTAGATSPDNNASANDTKTLTIASDVALSVAKTFDPSTVTAGDGTHTFTLKVTNNGTFSSAHAVHVTDTVDPTLVVDGVIDDQGGSNCTASSGQAIDCTFALLAAGHTATVTITYHVDAATQAQSVDNTGTASTPDNNSSDSDQATLTIVSDVALSVAKTFDPSTVTAGDGTHSFTLAVTNIGTHSTAHAVHVTDTVPSAIAVDAVHDDQGDTNCTASAGQAIDCTFALLPAGQTATVTVSYHVDPATPAQSVDNTGTASSPDNNSSNSDQATLTIVSDVALSLSKTFTPDTVTAGDGPHTFTLAVTNTGTHSTAHAVEITDSVDPSLVVTGVSQDQGAGGTCAPASQTIDCTFALLPHGQTASVTVTYHVDPSTSAGTVTNDATATSPDNNTSAPASATLTIKRDADLSVTKTAATDPTQLDTDETFTVTVKNLGPSDNAGYTLTDAVPAHTTFASASAGCAYDGSSTVTCTSAGLAFGASDTFTITVHVAADYPHNTQLSNTASIATSATPDSVSDDDSSTVTVDVASVELTKIAALDETVVLPGDRVDEGDKINYTFRVENTGTVTLNNLVVTDPLTGTHCMIASLAAAGIDESCIASHTLTQDEVDSGSFSNTAHVTGTATQGVQVSDDSSATVTLPAAPSVSITKTPTLHRDVVAPDNRVDAGDTISYVFSVTNDGNVTLTGVTVTDPLTGTNCTIGTLNPGATDTHCSAIYTLTQPDVDLGSRSNTATATGNPPQAAPPVSDDDTATVLLPAAPELQLVKSTQSSPYEHPGDELAYTYELTNTGNVTLGGPFAIHDDRSSDAVCTGAPSSIAPGESVTCTGTYAVTQADVDAGSVTNHATATANFQADPVTSNQDQATVDAIQLPSVSLTKTATETTYSAVGDVLHYEYKLTNTGNVTLSNPSVTDTNTDAPVALSNGNGNGKLNVGETWTFTATHTVTQADLDNGAVTNNATGHATFNDAPVDSSPQSITVLGTQSPGLTLVKMADTGTYDEIGQVIHYTYSLKNTGNVTLGPSTVTDDNIDFGPDAVYFSGDDGNGKMDPGETWVFTAQHTVNTVDIFLGSIDNAAQGHDAFTFYGDNAPTPVDSNIATLSISNIAADVAITKSASPDPVLVNDNLTYTLTVTNNGPHAADNVTVSDPVPSSTTFVSADATNGGTCDSTVTTVTCTFTTLAPGASATITIVVTPTSSGQITNTASVSSSQRDPAGDNNTATVTTTANARPTTLVYTGAITQDFDDAFTASGKLTDTTTGNPIAGKSVTFKLNNTESCSGTTNASGVASCSMTPGEQAGTYNVTASFGGDSVYASSSATATPFVVKHEETSTTYTGPSGPIQNGTTVTLSGVLKEDGTTPISGRTLTLSLGSQSCTGSTDASGVASCTILVNQPLGPGTAGAAFAGDLYYVPSSDSKATLIYASASGGNGTFVVGDKSATGNVYFWGSQWASSMNNLSGGTAPSAFKGFAKQPGTPSCGASWSTDPGNSAPPPTGPLPSFIAVIVTSKSTKSGSQISGNIVHIVIVKVNPGYSSDPGHPGTGTVVATVC